MNRRHLIIAGTGRAGTTLLVRYLTALGLDTHLSRRGDDAWLDEEAQAGLEDFPFGPDAADLPYLIKNPMLYEFVDQVLASDEIAIDAVIIPVRSLREATGSRLILERRSMYEHLPWLGFMDKAWESVGNVPGGLISSLSALDEARLLSMGLHLLVERLVQANIPIVFLDFPRIVTDATYLFEKLAPYLPEGTTADAADIAHAQLADPEKVRIEREIAAPATEVAAPENADLDEELDRIALRRELIRLQRVSAGKEDNERALQEQLQLLATGREHAERALQATHADLLTTRDAFLSATQRLEESRELAGQQRKMIDVASADALRLRGQIADLEVLRARDSTALAKAALECERQTEALRKFQQQYDALRERTTLLSQSYDRLASEYTVLEQLVSRLRTSELEMRRRNTGAERLMHEYLIGFSDELATIADSPLSVLHVTTLRQRVIDMLDQMETTSDELAIVSARLADYESRASYQAVRRVVESETFKRFGVSFARSLSSRKPQIQSAEPL